MAGAGAPEIAFLQQPSANAELSTTSHSKPSPHISIFNAKRHTFFPSTKRFLYLLKLCSLSHPCRMDSPFCQRYRTTHCERKASRTSLLPVKKSMKTYKQYARKEEEQQTAMMNEPRRTPKKYGPGKINNKDGNRRRNIVQVWWYLNKIWKKKPKRVQQVFYKKAKVW